MPDAIDIYLKTVKPGDIFYLRGREFRGATGCVSHYGPNSAGGVRTTVKAWNASGKEITLTLRPDSKITYLGRSAH